MNLWGGGSGAKDMARDLLASPDEVYSCLDMFEKRAQSCYFPQTPDLLTRREVSRFLERTEDNAEAHPDMLALIFAMVATAMQMGVYDRHGEWAEGAVDESRRRSDVYSTFIKCSLFLRRKLITKQSQRRCRPFAWRPS